LKRHFNFNFEDDLWRGGYVEVAAGLTAFLGHLFPIYLRFRGGKGVATGAGAVLVLLPLPTLAGLFAWAIVLCAARIVSLASIVAVLVLCGVHLREPSAWSWTEPRTWFCIIVGALVLVRHHANIIRLIKGTESQLKETNLMLQLSKSLHVLALGMWFGMSVFFTFVVGFALFGAFEALGERDGETETWFQRPVMYEKKNDVLDGPKEQGTRAAGFAVGPIFTWYFAIQGLCGFIALATALPWLKYADESRVHRWRINILLAAVTLVVVGWPIERKVHDLREPRNQSTEAYLREPTSKTKEKEMSDARSEFTHWHLASIAVNLAAIVCVTAAMAMAGNLSAKDAKEQERT
jgi:acyl phosphate:glycerol-3-phosphate acyltransferase